MSDYISPSTETPPATRWRLWIDGCGGYLLLAGDNWSIGGMGEPSEADVCIQADLPRKSGVVLRIAGDYFWIGHQAGSSKVLLSSNQPLPLSGSAQMSLDKPSALTSTAVLSLKPPHRLSDHVDGVILVDETILIGPDPDCHIRFRECDERIVLTRRGDRWLVKEGRRGDFAELPMETRTTLRSLTMTLEKT